MDCNYQEIREVFPEAIRKWIKIIDTFESKKGNVNYKIKKILNKFSQYSYYDFDIPLSSFEINLKVLFDKFFSKNFDFWHDFFIEKDNNLVNEDDIQNIRNNDKSENFNEGDNKDTQTLNENIIDNEDLISNKILLCKDKLKKLQNYFEVCVPKDLKTIQIELTDLKNKNLNKKKENIEILASQATQIIKMYLNSELKGQWGLNDLEALNIEYNNKKEMLQNQTKELKQEIKNLKNENKPKD